MGFRPRTGSVLSLCPLPPCLPGIFSLLLGRILASLTHPPGHLTHPLAVTCAAPVGGVTPPPLLSTSSDARWPLGTRSGPPTHGSALFLPPGTPALFNRHPAPPHRLHRGRLQELQPERAGGRLGEDLLGAPSPRIRAVRARFLLDGDSGGIVFRGPSFSESVPTLIQPARSPERLTRRVPGGEPSGLLAHKSPQRPGPLSCTCHSNRVARGLEITCPWWSCTRGCLGPVQGHSLEPRGPKGTAL